MVDRLARLALSGIAGGAILVAGPLYAEIRHIDEGGSEWPLHVGDAATSIGGGRYQVGPMVVEVVPFRGPPTNDPLNPPQYAAEHWRPLLALMRARAGQKGCKA